MKQASLKKLIIIDGNALVHRAFHALPPTLTKKDGTLTNAAYGFTLVLLNVIETFKPDYVVSAFDRKEKTFRHRAYREYKATRVKAPDELYMQIPLVQEVLRSFGIPVISVKGIEADDVIGIIANKVKTRGVESIIVTGDLDTLQLVDETTKVFTLRKGTKDTVIYDEAEVWKKYGLVPGQMVDYKALRGDPSDNIPGVSGVGEKTAVELLKKYKTLDGVYENLGEIRGSLGKKLAEQKDQAYLSYRLAKIETEAALDFTLNEARFGDYDAEQVRKTLTDLEFFSLIKRLGLSRPPEKNAGPDASALSIAPAALSSLQYFKPGSEGIRFITIWEKPADKILKKSVFECDLRWIATKKLGEKKVSYAKTFSTSESSSLVGFGIKQELQIMGRQGLFPQYANDMKAMAYLVDGGRGSVFLAALAERAGMRPAYPQLMEKRQKTQQNLFAEDRSENADDEITKAYLGEILSIMECSYPLIAQELEQVSTEQTERGIMPSVAGWNQSRTLYNLYRQIEMPLVPVLVKMEETGILVDTAKLAELKTEYQARAEELKQKIFAELGEQDFNLDSSQQLSKMLYEKMGFSAEGIKKGKSGFYSTSAEALAVLAQKYDVAAMIVAYRELTKLVTTYVNPLPDLCNQKTGRIHTEFNQEVTTTGRLSSSNPNLQNIPIRTTEGREIRKAFVASRGWKIVSADYSQIELRVAAHYADDQAMIAAFAEGKDIHTETAARVHGISSDQVTPEIRRTAKELNFGVIYGMGAYGFARSAGIERAQALAFIKKYKKQFPHVFAYVERAKKAARENGYVETLFARRRYIPEIHSRNWQLRASGERMAVNMPLQGTAADIMKLAMVRVYEHLHSQQLWEKAKMLLSVHDEILFEVREDYVGEFLPLVQRIMEHVVDLSVPLKVDVKTGDNWGEV